MNISYENDARRGPGNGILRCSGAALAAGRHSFALMRASDHLYLGGDDWVAQKTALLPVDERMDNGDLLLFIDASVVNQLDTQERYRVLLRGEDGEELKAVLSARDIIFGPVPGTALLHEPAPQPAPAPVPMPEAAVPEPVPGPDHLDDTPPPPPARRNMLLPCVLGALLLLALAGAGAWYFLRTPPPPPPAAQEQPQNGEQTAQQENPAEAPAASESSAIPNTPEPQDAAPSAAAPETVAPQEPNQSGDPAAADRPEQPAAAPEPQAPAAGTEVRVQSFFNGGERTPQAAARLSRELPAGTPAEQDAIYRLYYFAGENGESSVLMDYAACLDPGKPQWGSIDKDAPAAWELYEKAKGTQPQAASAQQALRTWLEQKAAAGDARAARWLRDINQESHP
ncbi:MAG: hypothetical protein PUB01_00025 [Desulfovibrionaceae bacterium]|nr:hypothetical protein [Desulfovibrionaceae bacterium]